jgi:hypothetical protein
MDHRRPGIGTPQVPPAVVPDVGDTPVTTGPPAAPAGPTCTSRPARTATALTHTLTASSERRRALAIIPPATPSRPVGPK